MCLIVAKPKGIRMPKGKKLRQWFNSYPDGFGIAFQYQNRVRLLKGAMDVEQMFVLIDKMRHSLNGNNTNNIDIVFQFRLAVTGSVCPKYCHPFPITCNQQELDSLDTITNAAIAHNGVISEYNPLYNVNYLGRKQLGKDINDAQEFIKDYLVDLGEDLWHPPVQKLIEVHTNSKFALLSNKGIAFIGDFIEDNGCWYSNSGYLSSKPFEWVPSDLRLPLYTEIEDTSWGVLCAGCQQYYQFLFQPAEDEGSLLCEECFRHFYNRPPTADEQIY